jgi:hypothetical protein
MHQGYDCDSAIAGDAMPNAVIAVISVSLTLPTMAFLLSFVCHLAAQKRWAAGFPGCRHLKDKFEKKGAPKRALFSFITSVSPPAVRIRSRGSSLNLGESVKAALPFGNFVVLLGSLFVAERKHIARAGIRIEGLRQCRRRHDAGGESNNRNELLHSLSPDLC